MVVDLHIAGPAFEATRRVRPGEPPLVLGRDADCSICLPDPDRNVSRRHLSVWIEGGQLHFQVLSVVNGVETPMGEVPPGARGVLPPGHTLALSTYRIVVVPVAEAPAEAFADTVAADPWAEFERQAAELTSPAGPETVPVSFEEDDPFTGDWGLFKSTFGPGAPGGPLRADALAPATDVQPFLGGLAGGDAAVPPAFTRGEMEALGRLTRIALQGLLQVGDAVASARAGVLGEAAPGEPNDPNPLRSDASTARKLAYLLAPRAAPGVLPPDRALAQFVTELCAHEEAMGQGVREAVDGMLQDFDPEALKTRLLGSGARLFESARAWDAYVREYAKRRGRSEEWVRQLLDRHFTRAYAKAYLRAKRNTPGRSGG